MKQAIDLGIQPLLGLKGDMNLTVPILPSRFYNVMKYITSCILPVTKYLYIVPLRLLPPLQLIRIAWYFLYIAEVGRGASHDQHTHDMLTFLTPPLKHLCFFYRRNFNMQTFFQLK